MNLKILVLCRLAPWILSQIWQIAFASRHIATHAVAAHLFGLCRAFGLSGFSHAVVVVAVLAALDFAPRRPNLS